MQFIKRGEVTKYAFDARDEPVLHVKQEESFPGGNGRCADRPDRG